MLAVSAESGQVLLLTLGITRIIEQESLDVSIHGSEDGETWGTKPLLSFPQKFYCGTYAMVLDLSGEPGVKYIRAQYKMGRWGRGTPAPLFGFYLAAEVAAVRPMATATA
ncbi:MAG: hypothetical protein J0L64_25775 [Acidobacteria bacterium]|nr:hypothetical protein [Acidobacteriota bacterium]